MSQQAEDYMFDIIQATVNELHPDASVGEIADHVALLTVDHPDLPEFYNFALMLAISLMNQDGIITRHEDCCGHAAQPGHLGGTAEVP